MYEILETDSQNIYRQDKLINSVNKPIKAYISCIKIRFSSGKKNRNRNSNSIKNANFQSDFSGENLSDFV